MATLTYNIGSGATIVATSGSGAGATPTYRITIDGKTSPPLSYEDMFNAGTGTASLFDQDGNLIRGWQFSVGDEIVNGKLTSAWKITTSDPQVGQGIYETVFGQLSRVADQAFKEFKAQAQVAAPASTPINLPDSELKIKPTPVTVNAVTLGANGQPITTPITINEASPIPDTGELKIEPQPITIDVDTLGADGNVTAVPVTINEKPLIPDPGELKIDIQPVDIGDLATPDFPPDPTYEEIYAAQTQATEQDQANFAAKEDWRVRLSLAPDTKYLYNAENPGILAPLAANGGTDGVIFPYTPSISVNYAANYEAVNIIHSNYKVYQYSSSAVEQVTIACDFTAQDTYEANYLLAVIHFFRSMTKMFYGQDTLPKNGTPPPLCYMYGMGGYQFAAHPLAISGFSYNLPSDVDYIKTTSVSPAGEPNPSTAPKDASAGRLAGAPVGKGGVATGPVFNGPAGNETVTWVPTKIQLSVTCLPIMSRNAISNRFSLEKYADGTLVNGVRSASVGGGMW